MLSSSEEHVEAQPRPEPVLYFGECQRPVRQAFRIPVLAIPGGCCADGYGGGARF